MEPFHRETGPGGQAESTAQPPAQPAQALGRGLNLGQFGGKGTVATLQLRGWRCWRPGGLGMNEQKVVTRVTSMSAWLRRANEGWRLYCASAM